MSSQPTIKPINTLPIESFLEKARIALKSNQKSLVLDIKEVQALQDSLAVTMTRIAGYNDAQLQEIQNTPPNFSVNMDGGGFK